MPYTSFPAEASLYVRDDSTNSPKFKDLLVQLEDDHTYIDLTRIAKIRNIHLADLIVAVIHAARKVKNAKKTTP